MNPEKLCLNCMREAEYPNGICEYCGFDPEQYQMLPHHLEPTTILKGRYLLGTVLGEGGFGITYIAFDLVLERQVAIKELFIVGILTRERTNTVLVDPSLGGQQYYQECKDKFLQEARLLFTLGDKSGIVDIFDYFEENGTAYLVMEYLTGMDLLTYIKGKGGRISYEEAFHLLRPVMRSMILVHRAGIIHRDIAPDNLRYVDDNYVKIMDFGSSKYNYSDYSSHIVLVKPGYAPREQYVKNYKVGPWMDVYAMGATFYRCITGKVPKPSVDRESDQDLEMPSSFGISLPPGLEAVLLHALALNPEQRYQDMWEFYQALKGAIPGLKPSAPGTGGMTMVDTPKTYSELMNELSSDGTKKNTGLIIGIAVGVVAAAAVLALILILV